jgi:2-polyprenyl-3-methyl-5-hydroxy-6-metoxy-1,4-benzoquinol methylase
VRLTSWLLRNLWARAILRNVHYHDRHQRLDTLYRITNPWDLDRPGEKARFVETNRLITREFGHVGSILELGCGEGHQSQYLVEVCARLHGCDVSTRAIDRARLRCRSAIFSVGTLTDQMTGVEPAYDLVVACEVLYYINDVDAAVQTMSRLGRACIATYHHSRRGRLDQIFDRIEVRGRSIIRFGEDAWTAVWWQNE